MKIGIIGAMQEEIDFVRNMMDKCKLFLVGRCKIYVGLLRNIKVILLESGVSKTLASINTTTLINLYKPDIIINIGTAAGISLDLEIGDIVIANQVCYHDVDMTAFGYDVGQICGYPRNFFPDNKLVIQMESCIKKLNFNAKRGLIVSGDIFVNNIKYLMKIRENFPQAIAVEMEATAIAVVCYNFQIPFTIIRSITDFADKKSRVNFRKHLISSSRKCCIVIDHFLKNFQL
ncbi:5'-methylthioadenosine/S-adenosylhomocysteine nucleosidase [Pantoea sp. SoEX]|uniref:5'-methylthioadenosine/S-adenosylhomocysteine nucleosidase n=1 Tax=Pantoea sp. SoEX TaxID=2576763 RepID=UPI0013599089|nr:5'-methylthioadenosine/S-adenosylhomocysteine nucleosidase [Pantoea sp. SoEX]MXP51167.1 5'-methylthioadenosine/S-adenosylhomocysteine nucleosidase [Pantoea sp. SoEX]